MAIGNEVLVMDLVSVDIEDVRGRVREAVADLRDVVAAYLFGSAMGELRPDSDIDIALFLAAGIAVDSREADLIAGNVALRLPPLKSHVFDVNVVDPSDSVFAYRVIAEGMALAVNNEDRMAELLERISRAYADDGYRYRLAVQEILKEARPNDA